MPHSLRTDRLLLRPVILRDAKPFWRVLNDPDYTRMTGSWAYPFSVETVAGRIRKMADGDDDSRKFWFSVMAGETLIGSGLLFDEWPDSIEIGYAIEKGHAGKGFATEVARALCEFSFGALRKKLIRARVSTGNPASTKVLTRLGFVQQGEAEMGWSEHYGCETPLYHYMLTREGYSL